jgi:hypothetical protein
MESDTTGIVIVAIGVLCLVYSLTRLGASQQAGWLLLGSARFRRVVVGLAGVSMLVGGCVVIARV